VIAARPEHPHRAFDRGVHVEASGAATGRLHWGLAAHDRYIDRSVFKSQVPASGRKPASALNAEMATEGQLQTSDSRVTMAAVVAAYDREIPKRRWLAETKAPRDRRVIEARRRAYI
jgi:hypothetical protein